MHRRRPLLLLCLAAATPIVAGCGSSTTTASGSTAATAAPAGGGTAAPGGAPATGAPASDATASPVGDISDKAAYVTVQAVGNAYSVKVPEGWSRTVTGSAVRYTDKLNSVTLDTAQAPAAPTVASATATEVPSLRSLPGYVAGTVTTVNRTAGQAVEITYTADAPPDPVTGKVVRDAVERYEFWRNGTEAIVTVSGPTGADNVDPWRIVTNSLTWA